MTSSFDCRKCKSIVFSRMQPFVQTTNCTMLESYFELLSTSLSLVRPAGKIPPSVNYTLLYARIMTLIHNKYKIMNVLGYRTVKIKILVDLS